MTRVTQNRKYYSGMAIGDLSSITTASYARTSTRQTDLEIASAGVDRARSWSCWVRWSNIRTNSQRVYNVTNTDNTQLQYALFLISSDNQTVANNARLRFSTFTNLSNVMEIQSSPVTLRNRYYHIVVTYTGSEVNTGLVIYVNGVVDPAPVRTTTGTYTGGLNNSTLRFKIGHETDAAAMIGDVAHMAIWNRVLTSGEVSELYNNGIVRANASSSFYADIVSDWPLTTNGNSLTNSNYNLTETSGSGISYVNHAFPFRVQDQALSFKRATVGNTRYMAFGNLLRKDATTVSWFGYSGTAHPGTADARIDRIDFDLTTFTASAPVTGVIDDGTYSMSGVSCGIDDNGHIHVFAARYNIGGAAFVDARHYKSTDGGATFDSGEVFATTRPRFEFYGRMIAGFAAGEFFVPFYEHTSAVTWTISVFKTTDNWATHSKIQVYDGTAPTIGESAIVNLGNVSGNNTLMILARQNGANYGIYRILSTDGGATWGSPSLTNLASTSASGSNCEICVTDNGKVAVFYMDRVDDYAYISKDNTIADIVASPTAFKTGRLVLRSYSADVTNILGYQGILNIGNGNVLAVTSLEFSTSRADLYFGMGSVY